MKAIKKLLFLTVLIILANFNHAQVKYKGWGFFGALTQSAHFYKNLDTDKKATDTLRKYFYPQSHISSEIFRWGAGVFLELGNENLRWQTELEYANKGAKEMALTNIYTGDRTGVYEKNKLTYIQWNNYLKFYYPLGFAHCYWMPGIRLEYLFKKSAPVFPDIVNRFPTFWFSGNIGIGYEFPLFKNLSAFAEYHWNPDIIRHKHDNTWVRSRTFELRAGVVMRPRKKRIDDCNAPVYKGPAY